MNRRHKFILIISIWAVCLPAIYLAWVRQSNPFFYRIIARATVSIAEGSWTPAPGQVPTDFPGYPQLIISLSQISGLPPRIIQYFPIGQFIVVTLWFVLLRKISGDVETALLYTIPMAVVPSFVLGHYSTFAYAWSRSVYIVSLLFILIYLMTRDGTTARRSIIGVLLSGTGLTTIYWTSSGWLLLNLFFVSFVVLISDCISDSDRRTLLLPLLALGSLFIYFIPTIQHQLVSIFLLSTYSSPSQGAVEFINKVLSLIVGSGSTGGPELTKPYIEKIAMNIWGYTRVLRYIILFGVAGLLSLRYVSKIYKGIVDRSWEFTALVAIGGTMIGHTIVYLARGNLSLRYSSLMIPIGIILLAKEVKRPEIARYTGVVTTVIAVIAFAAFITVGGGIDPGYQSAASGADWLSTYSAEDETVRVLSDFDTVGSMRVVTAVDSHPIVPVYYNTESYHWVVTGHGKRPDVEYAAINTAHYRSSVTTVGWKSFPPFAAYYANSNRLHINQNSSLVYDGKSVKIYGID